MLRVRLDGLGGRVSTQQVPDVDRRAELTTAKIVFIVIAAAAPLAAIVGTVPLMFTKGNGAGVPGAFILAGFTLVLFALGYAAMARKVVNTGAFYTYVAHGLGKSASVVAALFAVIAYNSQTVGIIGGFGYFTFKGLHDSGVNIPWWSAALFAIIVVGILGYRNVDVSAKVLAVLMVLEILLLAMLDIGIFAKHGFAAFPLYAVKPSVVFSAGLPIAVLFSFSCFIGFESAALYAEETHQPSRTIPRATYAAVVIIGVFYAMTAWEAVGAIGLTGIDKLKHQSSDDLGQLFFNLMQQYVGDWAKQLMGIMVLTSLLAAILATHNASARYMFALGRERVIPPLVGILHGKHGSPHRASLTQTVFNVAVVGVFALAGLSPYVGLASTMIGFGTFGIVALQAFAAFAVVAFFRRHGDGHWFRTGVAPFVAGCVLVIVVILTALNFHVLTNSNSKLLNALPVVYLVAALGGVAYALYLKRSKPNVYEGIAGDTMRSILIGTAETLPGGELGPKQD
jgi:amino acid transporter